MTTSVVLFTRDLRLHDHPPLRAALNGSDAVVPLFVRDRAVDTAGFAAPNRLALLSDCLRDLDAGLRERGGRLIVRSGDLVALVCAVAAEAEADEVHVAADVSGHAHRREEALRSALEARGRRLHVHDAVTTVLAPGAVTPAASDHFAVFTPYFRRWAECSVRDALAAPRKVRVPDGVRSEPLPAREDLAGLSPGLARGGEREARKRVSAWLRGGVTGYADRHDDLAGDATSRLSPHLHFGALSPVELVHRARRGGGPGAEAFVRQLAWRDFHAQVLSARPRSSAADYRTRRDRWRTGAAAEADVAAWKDGRTGYPIVDAAMRQLRHEGWMHNRGRLLVASFLTKTLYVDWRIGARHFLDLLADGDVANNQMNWQWTAGTGTDTRPHRVLNPTTQARRFDPEGVYVRRWVPELAGLQGRSVHEPWRLPEAERSAYGAYPDPIVGLAEGLDRFKRARGRD
ncbi:MULTISPECIES: cryptochrome/photolyase family protein [Streptomyces]|uniref:cryptochrome/photolyase family protein n=1 Tax=Streptomyces TaxID=1883 RepID=UPI001413CC25|nr:MULTISPECIES: deoxyribodipyrimidine photo-lyase [Streptomyces]MBZ6109189.1 DNA photolyase family protein [Streptomyces olivaceus]MBZ6123884.1 DNA photolyase family protein [Streptomyces olivaceus]MBZ6143992.1 DNA photolyase family protein [Streptomyces olivaceus]MBZ6157832.1 DNA photolyase family protein [Streptomyces olivaceus]MBZ6185628.1 DNA photolyase family protein [Streptomyces olivaceus]